MGDAWMSDCLARVLPLRAWSLRAGHATFHVAIGSHRGFAQHRLVCRLAIMHEALVNPKDPGDLEAWGLGFCGSGVWGLEVWRLGNPEVSQSTCLQAPRSPSPQLARTPDLQVPRRHGGLQTWRSGDLQAWASPALQVTLPGF